ncbi:MAG: hypothetical protein IJZ48_01175 [Oscillospiraceae bacterium]|nr:hypothetical protein [Oscillospiraceae bacterium]
MNKEPKFKSTINRTLYENLSKLTTTQFKIFYAAFVHYFVDYKFFITQLNYFNLWCELNLLCHELDESFPDPYDDYEAMRSFCHYHPYYFLDRIPLELVAGLFAEHMNDRVNVLSHFTKLLSETDLYTAYGYMNDALGLTEPVEELVSETQIHIEFFSY